MTEIGAIPTRHPRHVHRTVELGGDGDRATQTSTVVTILYCGQGMANVIEIYDLSMPKASPPAALGLVDFGVAGKSGVQRRREKYSDAVDYVAALLLERQAQGKPCVLDFVLISHQDEDHWALLPALVVAMKKHGGFRIAKLWLGGSDWKKESEQEVLKLPWDDVVQFVRARSDYDPPTTTNQPSLFAYKDTVVRVLGAQAPCALASKKVDIRRNGTSVVVVVECADKHAVLPGDATAETFDYVNPIMEAWENNQGRGAVHPCLAISIPHHGSERTFLAGKDWGPGNTFAKSVGAQNAVASAGYPNTYGHPRIEVMRLFKGFAQSSVASHTYVAYSTKDQAARHSSKTGIYSTVTEFNPTVVWEDYDYLLGPKPPARHAAAPRGL